MRATNETVYRCDFCNKAIVSAGFMKLHERMCKQNPKNKHKCFEFCQYLVKEQYVDEEDEHGIRNYGIYFTCKKRPGIELYSYKLERFKSNKKRLENMERMPLECELYKDSQYYDINDFTEQ